VIHLDSLGQGNPYGKRVFIAAALYDPSGDLAQGHWGSSILQLIHLFGEDNVFLSIYENDSGDAGRTALQALEQQFKCNSSSVCEDHLDLLQLPHITTPSDDERVTRIVYLAKARNRALTPLDEPSEKFDRVLFLNDVAFNPLNALQLLFSTNLDPENNHKPQYRAACAVDFINPFKFYDTYATRDLEGHSMGPPFFPWFSDSGSGQSRKDVLAGKDAVPVRSCWGGMVAFDALFFQPRETAGPNVEIASSSLTARFRALQDVDLFWDASECCLIHADIQAPRRDDDDGDDAARISEAGIYINPFVRVAYDPHTLSWLWTTRRFEKLYSIIHNIGNHLVGLPWFNPSTRGEKKSPARSCRILFIYLGRMAQRLGRFWLLSGLRDMMGSVGVQGCRSLSRGKGWKTIPMPARDLE
jgi:hypothetical protein